MSRTSRIIAIAKALRQETIPKNDQFSVDEINAAWDSMIDEVGKLGSDFLRASAAADLMARHDKALPQ